VDKPAHATPPRVYRDHATASLTASPEAWRGSSARARLSGHDDELVVVAPLLKLVTDWKESLGRALRGQRAGPKDPREGKRRSPGVLKGKTLN
jgi:hypothetical protein